MKTPREEVQTDETEPTRRRVGRRSDREDRTQSGVGSDEAERQKIRPPSGRRVWCHTAEIGADTVPEDPTKTKVVTSPDARNHRAQRDGTYLEGPHRPSNHLNWVMTRSGSRER